MTFFENLLKWLDKFAFLQGIPSWIKIAVSVVYDLLDFTGIPVVDTIVDIIGAIISYLFYGPIGLIAGWEIAEVTGQVDRFVPSLTAVSIYVETRK